MRGSGRRVRRAVVGTVSAIVLLSTVPAAVDDAQAVAGTDVTAVSTMVVPASVGDQGLAVVGGNHLLTRGHGSIPASLRSQGWDHIGDPGAHPGFVVDAYQGPSDASSKAFTVTYADGRHVLLVHPLAPGESRHNSFAAVSPDGRWLVSGEWGTVSRLLVFALPPESSADGVEMIPLAGTIALTHAVRDVQGCDFTSARQLICSTNDTTTSLFPVTRQLLTATLDHALDGTPVTAIVRLVGSVPMQNVCSGGSGEVEGIDATGGTLRVSVNALCAPVTEVFTFPHDARWQAANDIDRHTRWSGAPAAADAIVERRQARGRPGSRSR